MADGMIVSNLQPFVAFVKKKLAIRTPSMVRKTTVDVKTVPNLSQIALCTSGGSDHQRNL